MSIDPSKLGQVINKANQSNEDKSYDRTGKVSAAFFHRVTLNQSDEVAEIIEVLLGVKPGGTEKVAELLGINVDDVEETPALGPGKERPLPVFNADGSSAGIAMKEQQALDAGYAYKTDPSGDVIGYTKPPTDDPTPAPAAPATATHKVKVMDKHGSVKDELDIDDFKANAAKYQIIETDDDGKPTRVREVRFIGR